MLLEHLYRISLEESHRWAMFIGFPVNDGDLLPNTRIDLLNSYILGYRASQNDEVGFLAFFEWLYEVKKEFPNQGWAAKFLVDCEGNDIDAIEKFWKFLHEFLLETRPSWFIDLNKAPLPSSIKNGVGTPASFDIRNQEHIRILGLE